VPDRKPAPPEAGATGPGSADEAMAMAGPEPEARPPETPVPALGAGELIGLDQAAANRLFGTAAEKSDEPPATVWRYRNATCELDLFFYLDLRSGKMRTLHYAFKGGSTNPPDRLDCLRSMVVARGN
jgi:hypothetical protein